MITINNFSIIDNGSKLAIDVETTTGYSITSVELWNMNTFKDYSLSINLNYKLENVNNKEVFIVNASELGILKFEDIYFIEVQSDAPEENCSNCLIPAIGITYNLTPYYVCMLNELKNANIKDCKNCYSNKNKDLAISISLIIESIEKSIQLGYYVDAISNVGKLKKLCDLNQCSGCKTVVCNTCSEFKQI